MSILVKTYQTLEGPKKAAFKANCVACGSRLYVFDDGSSGDPRGAIKEHNNYDPLIASEYDMEGRDVPVCFACMNDQDSYNRALSHAKRVWKGTL